MLLRLDLVSARAALAALALAITPACGGGARPSPGTGPTAGTGAAGDDGASATPATAPAADPALATLLASTLPLPAEMSNQTECAGAATLGALVADVQRQHPDWTVKVTCDSPTDPAACTAAFTGPAGSSADPCSAAGGPGLTIIFSTDAAGAVVRDGLECSWF